MNHCYKSLGFLFIRQYVLLPEIRYYILWSLVVSRYIYKLFMDNEIAVWKLDRLFGTSSGTNCTLFHFWSMMQDIEMMVIMSFVIWPDEILQGGHRVDDPQHVTSSSRSGRKCGEIISLTLLYGNTCIHLIKNHAWTNLSNGMYLKNEMMPR